MGERAVTETDVVVIGGGPAGLAAACMLGRHDLRVLVLERRCYPVDKACGEGVMPPGVKILKECGVASRLAEEGMHPFDGIRFRSASGLEAEAEFAEGAGWGIRRTNLSQALRQAAEECPGVEIREGTAVERIQGSGTRMEAMLPGETVRSRLVVGADGLHSRVRQWAGLNGRPASRKRLGLRQHFALRPWSRFVEVEMGRDLEAYVTPCGEREVGVALLWDRGRIPHQRGGKELFWDLMQRVPRLRELLEGAEESGEPMATGPLEQRSRGRISDGVVLLGDAGGYLDACTGEGITLALKEAVVLEREVVPVLKREAGLVPGSALVGYEHACRDLLRPYYLGTRLMMSVQRRPRLLEGAMGVMKKRPDLLQHLLSFNMGTEPLWPGFGRLRQTMTSS